MRLGQRARLLGVVAGLVALAACSSSRTDCTCQVEFSGERRTLACGERACVGGTSVVCADQNVSVQRGTCTAPPASSGGDVTPGGPTNPGVDPSCGDLSTFCETSCGSPASVSSDCEATANAGDPAACAEWSLANGALCTP